MEEYLKVPILTELFNSRNEDISYHIMKKSKRYKNNRDEIEKEIKSLLNYVSAEHYNALKDEVDSILWKIAQFVEFWDETFYKIGIIDGMKLDKEIKGELEKMLKWKS